jgi:acetyl-CoA carboxylase carboxyl transferase subunit beta
MVVHRHDLPETLARLGRLLTKQKLPAKDAAPAAAAAPATAPQALTEAV